jgi:hypothetical protein
MLLTTSELTKRAPCPSWATWAAPASRRLSQNSRPPPAPLTVSSCAGCRDGRSVWPNPSALGRRNREKRRQAGTIQVASPRRRRVGPYDAPDLSYSRTTLAGCPGQLLPVPDQSDRGACETASRIMATETMREMEGVVVRPLIAVTTSEVRRSETLSPTPEGEPPSHEMALGLKYLAALEAAGAIPLVTPPLAPELALSLVDRVDGICLSGGPDLDPRASAARVRASSKSSRSLSTGPVAGWGSPP